MRPSMAALSSRPGSVDPMGQNLAAGNQIINQRRTQMQDDYRHRPMTGGPDLGIEYGMGQPGGSGLGGRFDDLWASMLGSAANQGKNLKVNFGGFGRTKHFDPGLNTTYDPTRGEVAPGMREGGGSYTPDERAHIENSGISMSALRRARGQRGIL